MCTKPEQVNFYTNSAEVRHRSLINPATQSIMLGKCWTDLHVCESINEFLDWNLRGTGVAPPSL